MELLKERIRKDGIVLPGNVLKVNGFLNHQMDIGLFEAMAKEWKKIFSDEKITKVMTLEASGIGPACLTAQAFGVPALFAKKNKTNNLADDMYTARVASFTHQRDYEIMVEKRFLTEADSILLIDDFLAHGHSLRGLAELVYKSNARLAGAGIAIEKGFQDGGRILRETGLRIESLAIIDSMDPVTGIVFRKSGGRL